MAVLIPEGLRNLKGVPSGVKKIARALQMGLDDDATVWYEPPYDPRGEKPDLVVLIPDRGIAVIEVLKWAKKARFLGLFGQTVRLEQEGREVDQANPLVRARILAAILEQRLKSSPELAAFQLPVRALAAFPDQASSSEVTATGSLDLDFCLFREDLQEVVDGLGPAALLRFFARALGATRAALGARDQDLLRAVIQPSLVLKPASEQLKLPLPAEGEDIIKVMDRKQEILAKSLGEGHRVLRGVAGSGKTVILIFRARLMAQAFPGKRFLLTCFTRSLRSYMAAQLSMHTNVEVTHLDGLMSRVIRDAGIKHPGYKGDDANEAVAQAGLEALNRLGVRRPIYDGVFVDEGQDFGPQCLRFIVSLLQNPEESDLLVVMDAAQNIFRRRFSFKQAGVKAQGRTRILRVNYRNAQEILSFAHSFLTGGREADEEDEEDETQIIAPEAAYRHGPYPVVQKVGGNGEVGSAVARVVADWLKQSQAPASIGVLYPSHSRGQEILQSLSAKNLPAYWGGDKTARDNLASVRDPVVLLTYHSAKGLEFPRVVLAGLEFDVPGDHRMVAYVGMTRAMNELVVVTGPNSLLGAHLPDAVPAAPIWSVTTVQGTKISLNVPVSLNPLETAALEALARHGQLSEGELGVHLGTRRIGGVMEKLMDKLAQAGCPMIQPGSDGSQGRVYRYCG